MNDTHLPPSPGEAKGITTFAFGAGVSLSSVTIQGAPWFIVRDLLRPLGFRDAHNATRGLDADEKGTHILSTPGGTQQVTVINESGLYALIMKSRKPTAKAFQKWVTSVVLPAIRRDGGYLLGEELLHKVEGLSVTALEDLEGQLRQALDITVARKIRRIRHSEEREARHNGLRAVKGRL